MKHYCTTFFVNKKGPICKVSVDNALSWPVTIHITDEHSRQSLDKITIHLNRKHWINFKNSVLSSDRKISEIFSGGGK